MWIPTEIASKQKVSVQVQNATASPIWLIFDGCMPLKIEQSHDGGWIDLGLGGTGFSHPESTCCNGSGCDPFLLLKLRLMAPGDSYVIDWDARALVFSQETFKCAGSTEHWSALQPVDPGVYRASVAYEVSLDAHCDPDAGMAECYESNGPTQDVAPFCGDFGALFGASSNPPEASTVFTLADSGDATVQLVIH